MYIFLKEKKHSKFPHREECRERERASERNVLRSSFHADSSPSNTATAAPPSGHFLIDQRVKVTPVRGKKRPMKGYQR